jgi:ArsR family transcriptional regulator, arsenate/arsenite/antimonite-responsive transcriptional repressor
MEKNLAIFKALSDNTRLSIVRYLLHGEKCVCDIVTQAKRTQSTVSIQLGKLEKWGILVSKREGKWMHYRIRDKRIYAIFKILERKQ